MRPSPYGQMPEMTRNSVDLPEPEGPVSERALAFLAKRDSSLATIGVPSGKSMQEVVERDGLTPAGSGVRFGPFVPSIFGILDRVVERGEAVDHRFESGERVVIIDEESERAFDPAERAGRLRHDAERDGAGKVERRGEDVGDDPGQLPIARGEGEQLHAAVDEGEPVPDDPAEAATERSLLGALAVEERDLLGVFAQPRQRKTEIGLHVLALEIETDQGTPDHMGDVRAGRRVDQGDPEQEAGDVQCRCPEW